MIALQVAVVEGLTGRLLVSLTLEQIAEMAPDGSSAAAGKKLMALKNWEDLGRNSEGLWGQCRGSALYQVKIDLSNLGYNCSCPSRKFPCKHVLGLLMLWASSPGAVAETDSPDWIVEWLERRRQKEQKKTAQQESGGEPKKPVDEKARQRRVEQRESRVSDGLNRLDVWIQDLVRNGIAGAESKPVSLWEEQARRLVDAQAPGLASRVSRLATLPGSSPEWPERLLAELGRLKLLIHSWSRIEQLDPLLQAEIRQILGFNVNEEDLQRDGELVEDSWTVIGQWVDDEDRIRAQRSWLIGRKTQRTALVLQFAPENQAFAEAILPGTEHQATLVYYPGTARLRAKFRSREGNVSPLASRPPGMATVDQFLDVVSNLTSQLPWLSAFGTCLQDVALTVDGDRWFARDQQGHALPLNGREHWKLLAITGGQPCDLAAEWDGHRLRPLAIFFNNSYRVA